MEITSEILEFKFEGNDIKPENLTLNDIAAKLMLFNKLVVPIVEEQFPDANLPTNYVGLENIQNRSLSFRYLLKERTDLVKSAFLSLLLAVQSNEISVLPARTIETLERTSAFNSSNGTRLSFGQVVNGEFQSLVSFSDQFSAEKIPSIKGKTSIYGHVKWVGGEPNHRASIVLQDNSEIKAILTKSQATELAAYLYDDVRLSGIATWKGDQLKLTEIVVQEINSFKRLSPEDGFQYLRDNLGKYWNDIDDPDKRIN